MSTFYAQLSSSWVDGGMRLLELILLAARYNHVVDLEDLRKSLVMHMESHGWEGGFTTHHSTKLSG